MTAEQSPYLHHCGGMYVRNGTSLPKGYIFVVIIADPYVPFTAAISIMLPPSSPSLPEHLIQEFIPRMILEFQDVNVIGIE